MTAWQFLWAMLGILGVMVGIVAVNMLLYHFGWLDDYEASDDWWPM